MSSASLQGQQMLTCHVVLQRVSSLLREGPQAQSVSVVASSNHNCTAPIAACSLARYGLTGCRTAYTAVSACQWSAHMHSGCAMKARPHLLPSALQRISAAAAAHACREHHCCLSGAGSFSAARNSRKKLRSTAILCCPRYGRVYRAVVSAHTLCAPEAL